MLIRMAIADKDEEYIERLRNVLEEHEDLELFVYTDESALGNVLFIYVPEASYANTDEEIVNFFKKILTLVSVTDDQRIMVRLFQYFNNGNPTLAGIAQILSEEGSPSDMGGSEAQPNPANVGSWQEAQPGQPNSSLQNSQTGQLSSISQGQQAEKSDADILRELAGDDKKAKKTPKTKKDKAPKTEKKKSSLFSLGRRKDVQQAEDRQNLDSQDSGSEPQNFWQIIWVAERICAIRLLRARRLLATCICFARTDVIIG